MNFLSGKSDCKRPSKQIARNLSSKLGRRSTNPTVDAPKEFEYLDVAQQAEGVRTLSLD
jgi:hypothetical protein